MSKEQAPDTGLSFIPKFKKEKPTVFVWPVFMSVGGAERNAIEVMRQLKDQYHLIVITMERLYPRHGSLHHQLTDFASAIYDLGEIAPFANFLDILEELKEVYDPDLIWITNGSPWLADNDQNLREIFYDVPIVDQQVYDTNEGWVNCYHQPGIQSFDRFVAINKKIQEVFIERYHIDPDRIDMIYHAVSSDRFDPARYSTEDKTAFFKKFGLEDGRKFYVFAGRLTRQKRPIDFLELALREQQAGSDAFFVMVGDGELKGDVDEFIASKELRNLHRLPFVENMAELYSIASGLILTSEFEGLPIVMLEALCMGVPVLATDVGDIKLVLEEYDAGLVMPEIGNLDSLAESYDEWTKDLSRFRTNAEANAATMRQRFSGENVARQYAECWERARNEFRKFASPRLNDETSLVSIIIPSYNHADYLEQAVESALAQTYERIEVIVIDDGSRDNSVEILRRIDDPRLKFFAQENQGAHATINRGLKLATGDFLTILNSDDVFHPNRIRELLAEFEADPDVLLLSSWIDVIDANGNVLGTKEGWLNMEPWPIAHPELSFKQTDDFLLNLLMGNFVATTSNIMMRRGLYEQIGGMRNLRFTHDWDFVLRAAAAVKCKLVPKPLLQYRVHETNTINTNRAWLLFELCWVVAANLHRVEGSQIFSNGDSGKNLEDLEKIYESINLQGNDKVFWVMRAFIESLRSTGVANPEEVLLQDDYRQRLINYINV